MRDLTRLLVFLTIFAIVTLQLNAQTISKPNFLLLPITKHEPTKQFYTTFNIGSSPKSPINLVIDLGTKLSWLDCRKIKSLSTLRLVTCKSSTCKSIPATTCNGNSCLYQQSNPFGLKPEIAGRVVQDKISIYAIDGISGGDGISGPTAIHGFTFLCAGQKNRQGLASPADGVLGLPPSNTSLIFPKFTLCLPSSGSGQFYIGGGKFLIPPFNSSVSIPFTTTPLVVTDAGDYLIFVLSISVDGIPLTLRSDLTAGGAKLSTLVPYTLLHSDIYDALANSFILKAKAMGISKVSAVAPFKDCFDARTIGMNVTGPIVPTIQIGVPKMIGIEQWTFYGANTMVKVEEKVMCLAFIDAGKRPKNLIEMGTYQLQDYMLEFDFSPTDFSLTGSVLAFSESLLFHKSSCSSLPSKK